MRLAAAVLLQSFLLGTIIQFTEAQKKPNFIVCQPDDLKFLERWTPPPHNDECPDITFGPDLPNIDRLRRQGLQMMEAYT